MEVSKDNLELIRKIKEFRGCKERIEILKAENKFLKETNEDYKDKLVDLASGLIDNLELLEEISDLKMEIHKLKLDLEHGSNYFDFLVTSPDNVSSVYGEIRSCLDKAKKEVLVCSPWITYLTTEFKNFFKLDIDIKVIVNWREEDLASGITDWDKLRVLDKLGADIRYNNDLHAKMLIVDSKEAIISSANLTQRGLQVNYEAGVIIRKIEDVLQASEFFKGVWEESKPLTREMIHGMTDVL